MVKRLLGKKQDVGSKPTSSSMKNQRESPWSVEEVVALNNWQHNSGIHPFTCNCGNILTATIDGWICSKCPDYHQNWAYEAMFVPFKSPLERCQSGLS